MADSAPAAKFSRRELADRNSRSDCVFVIDNVVYDVSKFLDEHPGGHEVLVNVAGQDASEDFDDVGHSLDAKELMAKYVIGEVVDEDRRPVKKRTVTWEQSAADEAPSPLSSWKLPLLLGVLLTLLYSYLLG